MKDLDPVKSKKVRVVPPGTYLPHEVRMMRRSEGDSKKERLSVTLYRTRGIF